MMPFSSAKFDTLHVADSWVAEQLAFPQESANPLATAFPEAPHEIVELHRAKFRSKDRSQNNFIEQIILVNPRNQQLIPFVYRPLRPINKFAVIGCQAGQHDESRDGCKSEAEKLQTKLAITEGVANGRIDAVIALGDTIYKTGASRATHPWKFNQSFHRYYSTDNLKDTPIFLGLGNHDLAIQNNILNSARAVHQEAIRGRTVSVYDRMMAQVLHTYLAPHQSQNWLMPNQYYVLQLEHANLFFLNSNFLPFDQNAKQWLEDVYQALNPDQGIKKLNIVVIHHPLHSFGKRYVGGPENDLKRYCQPDLLESYISAEKRAGLAINAWYEGQTDMSLANALNDTKRFPFVVSHNFNETLLNYFKHLEHDKGIRFSLFLGAHDHFLALVKEKGLCGYGLISGGAGDAYELQDPKADLPKLEHEWACKANGYFELNIVDHATVQITCHDNCKSNLHVREMKLECYGSDYSQVRIVLGQRREVSESSTIKLMGVYQAITDLSKILDSLRKKDSPTFKELNLVIHKLMKIIRDLTSLGQIYFQATIEIFSDIISRMNVHYPRHLRNREDVFPDVKLPIINELAVLLNGFNGMHRDFLNTVVSADPVSLTVSKIFLTRLVSKILNRPQDDAILLDWAHGESDLASVNNVSFRKHIETVQGESVTRLTVEDFCKARGLTSEQASFIYCTAHQNGFFGVLTDVLAVYRAKLISVYRDQLQFIPDFDSTAKITITSTPDRQLIMNFHGILKVKNKEKPEFFIPIAMINLQVMVQPHHYWESRWNRTLGSYSTPRLDHMRVNLQFSLYDKEHDPQSLKASFLTTMEPCDGRLVTIKEIAQPTSTWINVPFTVDGILAAAKPHLDYTPSQLEALCLDYVAYTRSAHPANAIPIEHQWLTPLLAEQILKALTRTNFYLAGTPAMIYLAQRIKFLMIAEQLLSKFSQLAMDQRSTLLRALFLMRADLIEATSEDTTNVARILRHEAMSVTVGAQYFGGQAPANLDAPAILPMEIQATAFEQQAMSASVASVVDQKSFSDGGAAILEEIDAGAFASESPSISHPTIQLPCIEHMIREGAQIQKNIQLLVNVIPTQTVICELNTNLASADWSLVAILYRYLSIENVRTLELTSAKISDTFVVTPAVARQSLYLALFCVSLNEFLSKWTAKKENHLLRDVGLFTSAQVGLNQLLIRIMTCIGEDSFTSKNDKRKISPDADVTILLAPVSDVSVLWFRYAACFHMLSLNFTTVRNKYFFAVNREIVLRTEINHLEKLFTYLLHSRIHKPNTIANWHKYLNNYVFSTVPIYQGIFAWLGSRYAPAAIERTLELLRPGKEGHHVHDLAINLHKIAWEAAAVQNQFGTQTEVIELRKLAELKKLFTREAAIPVDRPATPTEHDYANMLAAPRDASFTALMNTASSDVWTEFDSDDSAD